jgi:hypothetical protein
MLSCDFYNFPSIAADEAGACVVSTRVINDTVNCGVYIASVAPSSVR